MGRTVRSAKQAGAAFERKVADYLKWALDDDRIDRKVKEGVHDKGDIANVRYETQRVAIECKNRVKLDIPQYLREAQEEAANYDAPFWAVVVKRAGVGVDTLHGVGQQLVCMTLEQYASLLNHGLPLGGEDME